jgi:hypothetical protein
MAKGRMGGLNKATKGGPAKAPMSGGAKPLTGGKGQEWMIHPPGSGQLKGWGRGAKSGCK